MNPYIKSEKVYYIYSKLGADETYKRYKKSLWGKSNYDLDKIIEEIKKDTN